MAKEILEVTVTWAEAGEIIPVSWFDSPGWQTPDFLNDENLTEERMPDLVNGNGEPLRVAEIVSVAGKTLGRTTACHPSVKPFTWETLSGDARDMAHARLKEPWVSLDITSILPQDGYLSYEKSEGEFFGKYGCLEGWQDEIVKLAKATVKVAEIEQHATITLLVEVVAGDSHYDYWSGVTEWDGPVVKSVGLLDYGSLMPTGESKWQNRIT